MVEFIHKVFQCNLDLIILKLEKESTQSRIECFFCINSENQHATENKKFYICTHL